MKHIRNEAELAEYMKLDQFILFKHSATCPVSGEAFEEYRLFADSEPDVPTVYLIVQEDRELSNHIAETYHVKHQSPQAILFRNGNVAWHDSHWRIKKETIEEAMMN